MKNAKYKLFSAIAIGAGCLLGSGISTNDTSAIGNAAFEDENFYACVVRYYDKLFDDVTVAANVSDTVLTNAQLAKITKLNCGYRVDNEIYSNYGVLTPEYDNDAPRITSLAGLEKSLQAC